MQSDVTTKYCSRCKNRKVLSEFDQNKGGKLGLHSWCRICQQAYGKLRNRQQRKLLEDAGGTPPKPERRKYVHPKPLVPGQSTLVCGWCDIEKPLDSFKQSKSSKNGYERSCQECLTKRNAEYYQRMRSVLPESFKQRRVRALSTTTASGERRCTTCGQLKQLNAYRNDADGIEGKDWVCRECRGAEYARTMTILREDLDPSTPKFCIACATLKRVADFYSGPSRKDGLYYLCRKCSYERKKLDSYVLSGKAKATGRRWHRLNWNWDRSHRHDIRDRCGSRIVNVTEQIWLDVLAIHDYKCARCDGNRHLTLDHILSLRFGGPDEPWNVQPLCGKCNGWKRHDKLIDFRNRACREKYRCLDMPELTPLVRRGLATKRARERAAHPNSTEADKIRSTPIPAAISFEQGQISSV